MSEPDPIDVHVGNRLRQMRTSHSMSLEVLGKCVGVSYQQIQKYESGFNRISASTLWQIAGVFHLRVGWFFEGLNDAPGDEAADADAMKTSVVLGRLDPAVRREIRGLIDALIARGT